MKKLLALFTVITIAFTGCSIKKDKKTVNEMPADKPWNRIVMETENGYYYKTNPYQMALRYSEKSNGTDIYLCAKPECTHSGESTCTATYNGYFVTNYVLYDGFIYFAADDSNEESLSFSFYKVTLDGSSLDKVAEIRRVKNTQSNDDRGWGGGLMDICIHKGYAYIPYVLGHGHSYTDFVEEGFARVNILTGEVEILFSHDDFFQSSNYNVECGIGDYVYYKRTYNSGQGVYYRYNIKTGVSEEITGEVGEVLSDRNRSGHINLAAVTENTIYVHYCDNIKKENLTSYDINTFKKNDFELDLTDEYNSGYHQTMFYDNKIFVTRLDRIDVYSDTGELLGTHPIPSYLKKDEDRKTYRYDFRQFDISNNKIYMEYLGDSQNLDDVLKNDYYEEKDNVVYSMYSCSIEDIIAAKGDWEKQYTIINQ